jgi:HlyD family secretion protein
MDIARPDLARKKRIRRILWAVGALVGLALTTLGLSRLKPAVPAVDKSSLVFDAVKRGELLCQVRGNGILVPEDVRWIPALSGGRIDKILVLPGAAVKADTIILELSNPELAQAVFDAKWQVKAAQADLTNLQVQLDNQRLGQQATAASANANYVSAKLDAEVDSALAKDGLVPAVTLKKSVATAEELRKLNEIEQERLRMSPRAEQAQLAAQMAKVEQLTALLQLKQQQFDALKVRAGMDGVLQKLGDTAMLQVGQQVAPGTPLARVANPARLKAQVKIAETQAKDVQLGQKAEIDTRNGIVPGHVIRIDPAAENGTRTVDVALDGPLPKGAVPELSVDGTIELDRLENVLTVGRPVNGQPDSTVGLFKVIDGGGEAERVPVKLGRTSVSMVQVIGGLQPGDQVILSDMSQWDAYERVRLR